MDIDLLSTNKGRKMTIKELIKKLSKLDKNMEVECSIDCDTPEENEYRRIFGKDCMGINPYFDKAILCFKLECINFDVSKQKKSKMKS